MSTEQKAIGKDTRLDLLIGEFKNLMVSLQDQN